MYFVYIKKNGRFSFIKIGVYGMGFSCFLLYLRGVNMYEWYFGCGRSEWYGGVKREEWEIRVYLVLVYFGGSCFDICKRVLDYVKYGL